MSNLPGIKGFIGCSLIEWSGRLCAVIFLPGCNLRCKYCYNWELVQYPQRFPDVPLPDVLWFLRKYRSWLRGVVVTGGEPTIHQGLPGLLEEFKHDGWPVQIQTNGTNPTMLKALLRDDLVDYVALGIKAPLNHTDYETVTGCPTDVLAIHESLYTAASGAKLLEVRTTAAWPLLGEQAEKLAEIWEDLKDIPEVTWTVQNFVLPAGKIRQTPTGWRLIRSGLRPYPPPVLDPWRSCEIRPGEYRVPVTPDVVVLNPR